jgi:hypothetical protein
MAKAVLRKTVMLKVSQYLASNYTRAIVTKTAWYWHKNRHVDQWNRTEDPEITPHSSSHLHFDKGAKTLCWRKVSFFNKWCCENWISTGRRLKLDAPISHPAQKINSKWRNFETTGGKCRRNTWRYRNRKYFQNRTPIAQKIRIIEKWDYIKLKSFCTAKGTVIYEMGEKAFSVIIENIKSSKKTPKE